VRFLLLITVLALVALPAQHPFDWDRHDAGFLLLIIFLALVVATRSQAIPDLSNRYNAHQGPWAHPSADPGVNEDHQRRTELVMLWAVIGMVSSLISFAVILSPWNFNRGPQKQPFPDVRVEEPAGEGEAVRWGATKAISGGAGSDMVFYIRHGVPIQRGALDNKPARCGLPGEPALIFGLGQSVDLLPRTRAPAVKRRDHVLAVCMVAQSSRWFPPVSIVPSIQTKIGLASTCRSSEIAVGKRSQG
jgi:hypothetical protein